MSLPNPETVVTEKRLNEFYSEIFPYLGNSAAAGFTPVGTIISVMGNSAPANYLACNGQTVNISAYPELATYFQQQFGSKNTFGGNGTTTFGIPDLRGEFLRGTGTNSHANQGNGAAVGTHQDGTIHVRIVQNSSGTHGVIQYNTSNGVNTYDLSKNGDYNYARKGWANIPLTNSKVISDTNESGQYTSRPTNTSVLYCIATKNIYLNPSLDYSTDEKVVGTYIDGKPIYQKTISKTISTYTDGGANNSRRWMTCSPDIENLKLCLSVEGNIESITASGSGAPTSLPIPCATFYGFGDYTKALESVYRYINGDVVLLSAVSHNITSAKFVYTIKYIKTTD